MKHRLLAAVVSMLLVPTFLAACRSGHAPTGAAALPDPRGLALSAGDLPGFGPTPGMSPAAVGRGDACPGGPRIPDGTPPVPGRCDFTSFVVDSATSGPGREQIDATTRQDGNAVNPAMPALPITGPFVASHSGIFEIYDYAMVLASDAAAHDEFALLAVSRQAQDTSQRSPSRRHATWTASGAPSATYARYARGGASTRSRNSSSPTARVIVFTRASYPQMRLGRPVLYGAKRRGRGARAA